MSMAWSMIGAEVLKLRRRRGLLIWVLVLTLGVVGVYFASLGIRHAADPAAYPPAGGARSLYHLMDTYSLVAALIGVLVGATAGTADRDCGVFRDLVASGRSRFALFIVRVPGVLLVLWPAVLVACVLAGACARLLAGPLSAPSVTLIAHYTGWILVVATLDAVLALGLASLSGSRGITIGVLVGYEAIATPVLRGIAALGPVRAILSGAATARLEPPGDAPYPVPMSMLTAGLVIVAWAVAALALGAWRTRTCEA
jgi:hypothetical protein